jgi:hypothetical protein
MRETAVYVAATVMFWYWDYVFTSSIPHATGQGNTLVCPRIILILFTVGHSAHQNRILFLLEKYSNS